MVDPATLSMIRNEVGIGAFHAVLAERGLVPTGAPKATAFAGLRAEWGIDGEAFALALGVWLGIETATYDALARAPSECGRFSSRFLRESRIYPFIDRVGRPAIALAEPADPAVLQAVHLVFGVDPVPYAAAIEDIEALVLRHVRDMAIDAEPSRADPDGANLADLDTLRDMASGAPVVRALNELLERAIETGATDLHIEPMRDDLVIRLRTDGLLRQIPSPPRQMAAALISRVKIIAGLDIAERRLPQDGSARLALGTTKIDLRIAVMPSAHGETAVIRLLPRDRGLVDIGRIGLSPRHRATMNRLLDMPHGLAIITGPTGSGKTTTLAAALSVLNQPHRKILTIEDPIEYDIPGICQSQVKPEIGLTFASALRSFVRQDPDVIMVGEIRDGETAAIAVNAALTGHLVLTTLHTETAAGAVPRLIDLGVDDFLLESTLRAVVAQRLARILCPHCKQRRSLDSKILSADPRYGLLGLSSGEIVCEPVGCERCGGTGYRGRTGLFEILEPDAAIRAGMRRGVGMGSIEATAMRSGFRPMTVDAAEKCRAGITSPDEVFRVVPQRSAA